MSFANGKGFEPPSYIPVYPGGTTTAGNASQLSESSHKELAAVLNPLRERIQDFQNKVEATYETEAREVLSLKEQIKLIVETSHAIGTQADGLANRPR